MNEREKVLLAALLHDIGKFRQRAKGNGTHQEHTREFIESLYTDEDLAFLASGLSSTEEAKIISDAHSISAWETEGEYDDIRSYAEQPILAIPSIIRIEKGKCKLMYFPCHPLTLEPTFLEPKIKEKAAVDYKFWNSFEEELKKISPIKIKDFDEYIFTLLNLLYKYTFFIPSNTEEEKEGYRRVPDISLYEHLRTTSAFAVALYDFRQEGKGEKEFCLIWGDISGLQNFVFTLTSEKALKALKGRSIFLQLLNRAVANKILRRLKLPSVSLLSCEAGEFTILAPNIEGIEENLNEIRREINGDLLKNYGSEIYIAVDIYDFGKDDVKENIAKVFRCAKEEKVNLRKRKKWAELLQKEDKSFQERYKQIFMPEPETEERNTCVVCKRGGKIDKEGKCETCGGLEEFAKFLRNVEYIVEVDLSEGKPPEIESGLYKKILDSGFLILESKEKMESFLRLFSGYPVFIYRVNNTQFLDPELKAGQGFMFMATHAPEEKGEIKDLDKIAENSKGAKRIGILRMDVDSLGDIFGKGIDGWEGWKRNEETSMVTPPRFATLSSLFSFFFNFIVDEICKKGGFFTQYENWDSLGDAFVIYSGGDDLFIVGSWSKIFELCFRIREEFDIFFCKNPNITVSGALIEVPRKFPIYRSAQLTMERQKEAKEGYYFEKNDKYYPEKNALSIFGKAKKWGNLWYSYGLKKEIYKNMETNGGFLPRNFLFDLYKIQKTANEKAKSVAGRKLSYQVARYKERYKHESEMDRLKALISQNLKNDLDIPVRWVELLTRT